MSSQPIDDRSRMRSFRALFRVLDFAGAAPAAIYSSASLSLSLRVDNNKRKIASRGERNSEGLFLSSSGSKDQESRRLILYRCHFFLSFFLSFLPVSSQQFPRYLFQRRGGQERSSDASAIQLLVRTAHWIELPSRLPMGLLSSVAQCNVLSATVDFLLRTFYSIRSSALFARRGRAKSDCLDSFVLDGSRSLSR